MGKRSIVFPVANSPVNMFCSINEPSAFSFAIPSFFPILMLTLTALRIGRSKEYSDASSGYFLDNNRLAREEKRLGNFSSFQACRVLM